MLPASYFVWFECNVRMKFLLGSRTVHMAMFNFMIMFSYISLLDTSLNLYIINPLKPKDAYRRRTAPLTSKVAFYIFIQQL